MNEQERKSFKSLFQESENPERTCPERSRRSRRDEAISINARSAKQSETQNPDRQIVGFLHSYSAIKPFLVAFFLLLFVVEIPSIIIGWFISDIIEAAKMGAFLLLIPYFFIFLAILRQVGIAEITITNGKIYYRESASSKEQQVEIKDLDSVKFFDRFNPIFNTHETLSFLGQGGISLLTINLEKFSGENIKDFLEELKKQNPYIKLDDRANMLLG